MLNKKRAAIDTTAALLSKLTSDSRTPQSLLALVSWGSGPVLTSTFSTLPLSEFGAFVVADGTQGVLADRERIFGLHGDDAGALSRGADDLTVDEKASSRRCSLALPRPRICR